MAKVTLSEPRGIAFEEGKTWKMSRHVLSPTFSASKMKMVRLHNVIASSFFTTSPIGKIIQLVPLVQKSVDSLVKVFGDKAESKESFEFFK